METEDLWNFVYWDTFSDMTYLVTLNNKDLLGKGVIQHLDALHAIDPEGKTKYHTFEEPEDHYFYKLNKEKDNYLLPKRFYNELPMIPVKWEDVKLKPSDSNVWRFITEFDSFFIPEQNTMSLPEFVKQFNPVKHTNPPSATILKCIAIARGLKIAVCADYHCGKNAHYAIKAAIQNNVATGMKNMSEAMFYKLCLFNDDINIDEITTWTPAKIQAIEDKLSGYGDQSTKDYKHALDSNSKNEVIKHIHNKSFVITFNPYDEKKHPKYFGDNMGHPGKIEDRYPFLYFMGEVTDAAKSPVKGTEEQIVKENLEFFQTQASEFMYWHNNYHKHMHGYDRSKLCFQDVRKRENISPLIDVLDAMSISQAVFDYWVDFINESNKKYWLMRNNQLGVGPQEKLVMSEDI